MKKILLIVNLIVGLFFVGCTNVDTVMNKISSGVEAGIDNVMGMVEKLKGDTPASIKLPVPSGKNFAFEGYKLEIKYIEKTGLETSLVGKVQNKTNSSLVVVTTFPIYDLNGKIVSYGYFRNDVNGNTIKQLHGNYSQYSLKKDLRIIPEKVMTRVYSNDKLIATTHKIQSPKTAKQNRVNQVKQEKVENNNSQIQQRQTRQSVK